MVDNSTLLTKKDVKYLQKKIKSNRVPQKLKEKASLEVKIWIQDKILITSKNENISSTKTVFKTKQILRNQ